MALANFFSKNALAAHQILNGMAPSALADILEAQVIALGVDREVVATPEGRATVSLALDLSARLYPRIALLPIGPSSARLTDLIDELALRARAINPEIEIAGTPRDVTFSLVVGATAVPAELRARGATIYVGSRDWAAGLSLLEPVGSGPTNNPLGAGAAACFAAANVFRAVFAAHLSSGRLDDPFVLSLFDYTRPVHLQTGGSVEGFTVGARPIPIGETVLAGVGAISNGFSWALARTPDLEGILHLIDPETITLTNLQRYVLATQVDAAAEVPKVALAARILEEAMALRSEQGLRAVPHALRWGRFLQERNDWGLERVIAAFDTIGDRVAAQAALPRVLLNAWTQVGDLGVSRHLAFGEFPCAACLYRPITGGKSEAERVGDAMGLPGAPLHIREMLYSGVPIEESFIREVAARRGITEPDKVARLVQFQGQSLRQFYNDAFCGGVVLQLGGNADINVRAEAPMAFQSVLAGIMLASALITDALQLRPARDVPIRTVIDLLRPLAPFLEPPIGRREDGRCLCQDPDYLEVYAAKYPKTA